MRFLDGLLDDLKKVLKDPDPLAALLTTESGCSCLGVIIVLFMSVFAAAFAYYQGADIVTGICVGVFFMGLFGSFVRIAMGHWD